jgi:hypothetical protein
VARRSLIVGCLPTRDCLEKKHHTADARCYTARKLVHGRIGECVKWRIAEDVVREVGEL